MADNNELERTLWAAADKMRSNMDSAEYKHIVLGLISIKYIFDWGGERLRDDKRWQYGMPLAGNANFTWVQHITHHLVPPAGRADFVLANGSMSSNLSSEGEIRRNMIEVDLMDCMAALPSQFLYSKPISVRNWIRDNSTSFFHSEIWKN